MKKCLRGKNRRRYKNQLIVFVKKTLTPFENLPKWRNWQTRWVQGPVGATLSGFKSRLRHHIKKQLPQNRFSPFAGVLFIVINREDINALSLQDY